MHVPFEPSARDVRADELLGEFPKELFGDRFYAACELVDRYSLECALEVAQNLGISGSKSKAWTVADLRQELGVLEAFEPALGWLLDRLAAGGSFERQSGSVVRYRQLELLRPSERELLRTLADEYDCGVSRTLNLFDSATELWPKVLRGECRAEECLLGPRQVQLWVDYFHNDNWTYAISNWLTSLAAIRRLPQEGKWRILEVGAGAGSATFSFLLELERLGALRSISDFRVTEPATFFRRRAERELRARFPGVPLSFQALDLDQEFSSQGITGPFDLVFGVNVFHVARNLPRALEHVREVLAPGAWVFAGECFRLFPGQPIPAELVFQLLKSFREVELDDRFRRNPGFLDPESWLALFEASGFGSVAILPDLLQMRAIYPRFFSGVVVGRHGEEQGLRLNGESGRQLPSTGRSRE